MNETNKPVMLKVKASIRDELKKISQELGMGSMNSVIAMLLRDYKKGQTNER